LQEVSNVSEQKPEQAGGEPGSISGEAAASLASDRQSEPAAASVPDSKEEPKGESAEAPRTPGKVMVLSSGDRAWNSKGPGAESGAAWGFGRLRKRRVAALAAVVAVAALAGAVGGALATAALGRPTGDDATATASRGLETSIARIEADILALKASVEQAAKTGTSQFSKASDRLDKLEKAQAEPAAKLAKLSEAVDRLRGVSTAAPATPAAVAAAPAKDVTGSIAPPATNPPKVEAARLPTVEGWVLRDVGNGGALIQGRQGIYEVYAGDPVPGLGRVDAIRRQDGRWVVVTSKGLIVAR
jgi:hypothetical protein